VRAIDKLHCIQRELRWRYKVFPKRVNDKKMTQAQADREIKLMEEIAADYRKQVEEETPGLGV
jgi:hypothetical protein